MIRLALASILVAVVLVSFYALCARADDAASPPATQPAPVLNFTMKDIDGHDVDLSQYQGNVILIVNVASKCGNTPQYTGLEKLYQTYKDRGFVILAFPANNFGGQEPGTNAQIKQFCTATTYHVTFPIFSKISVKGDDMAPLYKTLTSFESATVKPGNITWNFEKFLIARDGTIAARFAPRTQPTDPKLIATLEAQLASK